MIMLIIMELLDIHGVVNVKEFYWLNNKREKEEVDANVNLKPVLDQEIYNDDFKEERMMFKKDNSNIEVR